MVTIRFDVLTYSKALPKDWTNAKVGISYRNKDSSLIEICECTCKSSAHNTQFYHTFGFL